MDLQNIAKKIIRLKEEDSKYRDELIKKGTLSNGYNKEMEVLHNKNTKELNRIIDTIGYPTPCKVGEEASEAAWLIIQHSINRPGFMRKCAALLAEAVEENMAEPKKLAYLADRIAVFEGKKQQYGTQFDWDDNGEMSPKPIDDSAKVNQKRKSIGLNTLEEQTKIMRERVKRENQQPPEDLQERKRKYDEWRKSVGWIMKFNSSENG